MQRGLSLLSSLLTSGYVRYKLVLSTRDSPLLWRGGAIGFTGRLRPLHTGAGKAGAGRCAMIHTCLSVRAVAGNVKEDFLRFAEIL